MSQVFTSTVIPTTAEQLWAVVRDFNGLPDWHPVVASSCIEGDARADQIGCIRAFNLQDGGFIREKLLALSDYDYSCSYSILESPMGVENYIASFKLIPITDGNRCYAEWTAEFDCAEEAEAELIDTIGNKVFQAGFDALKERFKE
ncbi:MAG: SRPBCC family protein [Granulosicoccus sp.]